MKVARGIVAAFVCLVWTHSAQAQGTRGPATPPRPSQASQEPAIVFRPFGMGTVQYFSAHQTFDAIFGSPVQPLVGGGLQVVFHRRFLFEATVSWWQKTGERAFVFDGEVFPLGQPLVARLVPLEFGVGYRAFRPNRKWIPYVTVGGGLYTYREDPGTSDELSERGPGFLGDAGVEWRVARSWGLAFDAHYTYVSGILGKAGVSELANEKDFGGIAGRVRLIYGR